jgi:hypothetical protein
MIDPVLVQLLDTLSLPVAALIAVGFLWTAYNSSQNSRITDLKAAYNAHVEDLRSFNNTTTYDLRARVMALEDRAGIKRDEKFKYIPHGTERELEVAAELDK